MRQYQDAVAAGRRAKVTEYVAFVASIDEGTGRVILDDDLDADCASGYLARKVGDEVLVKVVGAGNSTRRVVLDRIGAEWQQAEVDVPAITNGTGAPSGSGWSQVSAVYVRDGGLYFQTATSVTPATSTTRAAATTPTGWRVFRGGVARMDADGPMQGDWGYGAHSTIWIYPETLAAALVGASTVTLHLTRKPGAGTYAPTPVMVRLHANSALPSSPSWVGSAVQVGTLTASGNTGQTGDFELPSGLVAQLRSGAALGVGLYGTDKSEYMTLTAASGGLTIT